MIGRGRLQTCPMHMSRCPDCGSAVAVVTVGDERLLVEPRDVVDALWTDDGDKVTLTVGERFLDRPIRIRHACPNVAAQAGRGCIGEGKDDREGL